MSADESTAERRDAHTEAEPAATGTETAESESERGQKQRKTPSKFWTRTRILVSGTIAFLGAATGVVSVVQPFMRDTSGFESLELTAEPVSNHVTEWALTADALALDFPADNEACGAEQLGWLEAHAQPLANRFVLDLRNRAAEGPMLALQGFHAVGAASGEAAVLEENATASIRLVCDPRSGNQELLQVARLDADRESSEARFVRVTSDGQPLPELPVAWNLAPGETGKLELQLFNRLGATGRIAVEVTSRGETREFVLDGSEFDLPPLLFSGDFFLRATKEGIECQRVEQGRLISCTLDEAREALQQRNEQG